jgi:hypothetical protein
LQYFLCSVAMFSSSNSPQILLCKKKIPYHIKMPAHVWSTKCRWNQKLIAQFCCTLRDVLSLINQCLDNYYQIKTKLLQCSIVLYSEFGDAASKHGVCFKDGLAWCVVGGIWSFKE